MLTGEGKLKIKGGLESYFDGLRANPLFQMLPLTHEVALEVAALGVLRDPADRVIAATARLHRLRLVTSDQRMIESGLVGVVE